MGSPFFRLVTIEALRFTDRRMAVSFTILWYLYLVMLPLSLGGMEVFSSLLILLVPFILFFQKTVRKSLFSFLCIEKYAVWSLGLIAIAWIIAIILNQRSTVLLWKDIEPMRRFLLCFVPLLVSFVFKKNKKEFPWANMIACLLLGLCLALIIGYWKRQAWHLEGRYSGAFSFAFTYAACVSIELFVLLWAIYSVKKSKQKAFPKNILNGMIIGALLMICGTIVASQTRSVWIGLGLLLPGLCIHLVKQWKQRLVLIGALVLLVALVLQIPFIGQRLEMKLDDKSFSERSLYARAGWLMAQEALPWGVGPKSPARLMPEYSERVGKRMGNSHTHNHWIETLASLGILGVIGWAGLFGAMIAGLWRSWRATRYPAGLILFYGVLQLFVLSLVDVIFVDAEMAHHTAFLVGVIFAYLHDLRQEIPAFKSVQKA